MSLMAMLQVLHCFWQKVLSPVQLKDELGKLCRFNFISMYILIMNEQIQALETKTDFRENSDSIRMTYRHFRSISLLNSNSEEPS